MTDARHLGLVTGGTDSERSDTFGINMAPKAERLAALRDVHYIPTTTAEPECGDRAGSVTMNPANVGCLVCLGKIQAEVERLRARAIATTIPAERERIQGKLAALGTVIHPAGTREYVEYTRRLRAALAEWAAGS